MKIPVFNLNEDIIKKLDFDNAIIETAIVAAGEYAAEYDEPIPLYDEESPEDVPEISPSGGRFIIPLAAPEEVESGDDRIFKKDSLTLRNLPIPLLWQIKTAQGHDGSVVVGRIDYLERIEGGIGNGYGVFDTGVYGREAERLVRGKFLRGISVDLDKFAASTEKDKEEIKGEAELSDSKDDSDEIKNKKMTINSARLMAITLVPKPAFEECYIVMEEEPTLSTADDFIVDDGIYESMLDSVDAELAAISASAAPVIPPKNWFTNPKLSGPTPLTVDEEGRVFGHIATWHVDHIGLPRATKPPRSASNYAYFRTGVVRTDDGTDVPVGQLTLSGGHAPLQASARDAVKHYDDTASAVADLTAGEDAHGIWVSGALRPEVTPTQVRALRASAPSGDWRPIGGRLELVAICQVNVPGFPVARSIVAGGQIQALVAAGAAPLAEIREAQRTSSLEARLAALEHKELAAARDAAIARMADAKVEHEEHLQALAASARQRMADVLNDEQAELAQKIAELKARFNN